MVTNYYIIQIHPENSKYPSNQNWVSGKCNENLDQTTYYVCQSKPSNFDTKYCTLETEENTTVKMTTKINDDDSSLLMTANLLLILTVSVLLL